MSEVWKQARDEIIEKLELNERGNVKKSRMNCLVILREDPVLRGRIKSNLFTERIDLCDLPWNRATHTLTMFTALDTVKALLDVLEETTLTISTIDA